MHIFWKIKHRRVRRGHLKGPTSEYQREKERARLFVHRRLAELNQAYRLLYKRVAIKNSATRWGSCSKQGNLNFHYRLVLLDPALADYVFVHELCHLQELNHSPKFWALVARAIPDYKSRRRALKSL